MTGCLLGRGETRISIWGCWAAKVGRTYWRKALGREMGVSIQGDLIGRGDKGREETYFMPLELPAQSQ